MFLHLFNWQRRQRIGKTNRFLIICVNFKKGINLKIYIANFILMDYGTGAIFGCPAHDQRDYDFATKYSLDIIPVVENNNILPYV